MLSRRGCRGGRLRRCRHVGRGCTASIHRGGGIMTSTLARLIRAARKTDDKSPEDEADEDDPKHDKETPKKPKKPKEQRPDSDEEDENDEEDDKPKAIADRIIRAGQMRRGEVPPKLNLTDRAQFSKKITIERTNANNYRTVLPDKDAEVLADRIVAAGRKR